MVTNYSDKRYVHFISLACVSWALCHHPRLTGSTIDLRLLAVRQVGSFCVLQIAHNVILLRASIQRPTVSPRRESERYRSDGAHGLHPPVIIWVFTLKESDIRSTTDHGCVLVLKSTF